MDQALIRNDVMAGAGPLADQSAVSSGDGDSHSGVVGDVLPFSEQPVKAAWRSGPVPW